MKKPPKPSRLAEEDQERHETEQRRQEVFARLAKALKEERTDAAAKRKPGDPLQNGDPYNTAGPTRDSWNGGRKR